MIAQQRQVKNIQRATWVSAWSQASAARVARGNLSMTRKRFGLEAPVITGIPGLIIPAFSAAMEANAPSHS